MKRGKSKSAMDDPDFKRIFTALAKKIGLNNLQGEDSDLEEIFKKASDQFPEIMSLLEESPDILAEGEEEEDQEINVGEDDVSEDLTKLFGSLGSLEIEGRDQEDKEPCEECQEVSLEELIDLIREQDTEIKSQRKQLKSAIRKIQELHDQMREVTTSSPVLATSTDSITCSVCGYIYNKDTTQEDGDSKSEEFCRNCKFIEVSTLAKTLYSLLSAVKYVGGFISDPTFKASEKEIDAALETARSTLSLPSPK